jgi:hypothetical protein
MKKNIFIFILFSAYHLSIIAQTRLKTDNLYVYPEIQKAVARKTRSVNGYPGENYWQNKSKYKINAALNTDNGQITGSEQIAYFNNSPDSLNMLVIRLYADFYKCTNVKDYTINEGDCSNGVNISKITLENDSIPKYRVAGTNMYVTLPRKLAPHTSIKLNISWDFYLPKKTHIREGVFYQSSYFVAYWYPQVAVYDDYSGWDYLNYTGLQEFYNDFNDYDVTLSVPKKFLTWATGDWINSPEVLRDPFLKKYKQGLVSDTVVHVVDSLSRKTSDITLGTTVNSYHYTANSVCDFSFSASDTYVWDMISVNNGTPNNKVSINLLYHPSIPKFGKLAGPAVQVIKHLSTVWPGVPYPYAHLTVFSGDGGMEYAMMINQGDFGDEVQAAEILAHETAHTYFPFLVGTNERKYAWMDEGFAQTLPNDCLIEAGGEKFRPQQLNKYQIKYFSSFIGTAMESPPMEPSINVKGGSYYFSAYNRPALALTYLREILGDEIYKRALNVYIDRWKYKHPSPYDFFNTINDVSKRNLNWFWKAWFFDHAYPDIAIAGSSVKNNVLSLKIEQLGTLPVPLQIKYTYQDGTAVDDYAKADIWDKSTITTVIYKIRPNKKLAKVEINQELVPDIDLSNNSYTFK